jgi:GNAT superfamily N-acetyltransferase
MWALPLQTRHAETVHAETVSSPTTSRSRLKAAWFQDDPVADGLDFGLATDRRTFEQAFSLQHDQYVAHGYMNAHPSGWRLSLHNALSATRVFVARCGDRVVGTMTLIADSPLGLPMEEIYTDELRRLRDGRGSLAEVSALAVDPAYQSSGVPILLRLIRMLVIYAAQSASDLCIAVNPHHAAFYRKAFHFQDIGGLKQYGKVNGAPAIALRLDLALARSLMRELRDGHRMISSVYEFLFHPAHVEAVMTRLVKDSRRIIPPEDRVEHFFSRHEAWTEASEAARAYILAGCDPSVGRKLRTHLPDRSNHCRPRDLRGLAMA